ncbi:MAG TPA: restriction endonuclease subunit S [Fervidobacterium sp.]|nr:restriction endonuclease subunit S [Fervidobacterium sp.]
MKIEEKTMENKVTFYEETNFKNTEIGEIPKDWEVVKLGEVLEEVKTKNKEGKSLKVYSVSNIHGFIESDEFFDRKVYSVDLKPYKVVMENYFAYNPYRVNVGSIGLFTEKDAGLVSPAYVVFKIKNEQKLMPEFLYSNLKSPKYISEISRIAMSRGSVRRSLSFKDLGLMSIPLPPLEEQKAIAYVLSTVQEAREKTEKVIEATKELKKSLMKHLFTYGPVSLEETSRINLKETEIGEIPTDWEVVKLGEITKAIKGAKPKVLTEDWEKDSIPYLTADYLRSGIYKYFVPRTFLTKTVRVRKDDVVLIWDGSNSGDVFTGVEGILASTMVKILPLTDNLLSLYLYYFLKSKFELFNTKTTGSTIPHVSKSVFQDLPLPLPPLPVQKRIAEILQTVDEKIQAEEKKKQALENLFNSMLHMLMSGKLRVKFQTSEEGASN